MCQTLETKQEPSFVSNTFSKQVRGSWAGTQLKGISLSLSFQILRTFTSICPNVTWKVLSQPQVRCPQQSVAHPCLDPGSCQPPLELIHMLKVG